jgi:hypothetical protein
VRNIIYVLAACVLATSALAQERAQERAQEPVGCDKFKWPLDTERATLTGTDLPKVESGTRVTFSIPFGTIVGLKPFADAKLPAPPERTPKSPDGFAGFFEVTSLKQAGSYKITLSAEGWIDVAQSGQTIKSTAFSGALGCDGVRKSVKFDLAAAPFTVELSGVRADTIKMAISGN